MSLITGRILDEANEPISGVRVWAMRPVYFEGRRRLVPQGQPTTTRNNYHPTPPMPEPVAPAQPALQQAPPAIQQAPLPMAPEPIGSAVQPIPQPPVPVPVAPAFPDPAPPAPPAPPVLVPGGGPDLPLPQ